MKTFATDGTHMFYDPDGWMKDWSDEELMFVVAHEIGHCCLGHLWRIGMRDKKRWAIASDFPINNLLKLDGLTAPKGCLEGYNSMSAEEVYDKLKQNTSQKPLDHESMWEKKPGQSGNGQGKEQGADGVLGELEAQATEQEWREHVAQAAVAARMRGKFPAYLEALVGDLLSPTVDWRELLRDMVTSSVRSNYRLFPPNKRYLYIPVYLPSMSGEEIEVAVAVDTSGSISDEMLREFISEMTGIAEQFEAYRVHVFSCDAQVLNYTLVSNDDPEWPKKYGGRGGTDFRPVFEQIEKRNIKPSCLVYFTDTYGAFPDAAPEYPVIWLTETRDAKVPWGTVILIRGARGEQ